MIAWVKAQLAAVEAKLVWDWRQAWKWLSVQLMSAALAVQGYSELVKIGWASYPDDLKSALPGWVSPTVSLLLLGALFARIWKQKKPEGQQ